MKTRVLIIGAGGAGLCAALAAAESGAEVTVVSKTPAGTSTSTAFSGGVFTLASGDVTPDMHFERTMKIGGMVNNPRLVRVLADNAEKSLKKLQSMKIDIAFPRSGTASVRQTARRKFMGGSGFISQLVSAARSRGVRFIEDWAASRLLLNDDRISGCEFVCWRNGTEYTISADAVVIASGGAGQIFSRTDNPARMTGDGYALAVRAGLPLIDMEFTQFYPLGWADPALPVWMADLELIDFLPLTDRNGCEFLLEELHGLGFRNGREGNLYARDRCAASIAEKAAAGGAFVHFEKAVPAFWSDKNFIRSLIMDKKRFMHLHRPVLAAPLEHYFCGGIKISTDAGTPVRGLYACGEVTGGVDGANRIGGNALANIVTFGLRAGRNAAAEPSGGTAASAEKTGRTVRFPCKGVRPSVLRRRLQETMWRCLGPIRTEMGIKEALAFLDEAASVPCSPDSPEELLKALEMPGLIASAKAVAEGALARKESLGTHFRKN